MALSGIAENQMPLLPVVADSRLRTAKQVSTVRDTVENVLTVVRAGPGLFSKLSGGIKGKVNGQITTQSGR